MIESYYVVIFSTHRVRYVKNRPLYIPNIGYIEDKYDLLCPAVRVLILDD